MIKTNMREAFEKIGIFPHDPKVGIIYPFGKKGWKASLY